MRDDDPAAPPRSRRWGRSRPPVQQSPTSWLDQVAPSPASGSDQPGPAPQDARPQHSGPVAPSPYAPGSAFTEPATTAMPAQQNQPAQPGQPGQPGQPAQPGQSAQSRRERRELERRGEGAPNSSGPVQQYPQASGPVPQYPPTTSGPVQPFPQPSGPVPQYPAGATGQVPRYPSAIPSLQQSGLTGATGQIPPVPGDLFSPAPPASTAPEMSYSAFGETAHVAPVEALPRDQTGPLPPIFAPTAEPVRPHRSRMLPGGPRTGLSARGKLVLLCLSLGFAAIAVTCLIDTTVMPIAASAALAPLLLIPGLIVLGIALRERQYVTAAVTAVASLAPWWFALGYMIPGPGPEVTGRHELTVMTINAQAGGASPDAVVRAATRAEADVVVVTEMSSRYAHELTVSGLTGIGSAVWVDVDTSVKGGIGVWSKYQASAPAEPITGTTYPTAVVHLATPSGDLPLIVGHAEAPTAGLFSTQWHADLSILKAAAEPIRDGVLVGDLNAGPWHPVFRNLASDGWRDSADRLGHGLRTTWPSWLPMVGIALDHILVRGKIDVQSVTSVGVDGTDHRALFATLRLDDKLGPAPTAPAAQNGLLPDTGLVSP